MSVGQTVEGVTTPIAGAGTDAAGNATVVLSHAGSVTLKATGAGAVRSNGLTVCVHNGEDGSCGTTRPAPKPAVVPTPFLGDRAQVAGITAGQVYSRGAAPRLLRGLVQVLAGGTLHDVRISLQRRFRGRCSAFNGARGRFVRARCARTSFFSVGNSLSFSYLLPARLGPGRYVYDIEAVETSGRTTALLGGVSHVVFRVR
jgi:hypothetical protein